MTFEVLMEAMVLKSIKSIEQNPLNYEYASMPIAGDNEVLIRVKACGICHTDLHIIEGEIPAPKLPLVPGHQVVGVVEAKGKNVKKFKEGERVAVPWLYSTCGRCEFCQKQKENLCESAQFTGYSVNGGYARFMVSKERFTYHVPRKFSVIDAAPLLCAGVIGYRAFKLSKVKKGEVLGLYGFGASAHLVIQIAIYMGCQVYVFSRSQEHRKLARELGASWTGFADDTPPEDIHSGIIFAPAGKLVPEALRVLKKGGTLVLAGIYMTPIPQIQYSSIYHEREIKTVANSTRRDVEEFLELASKVPVKTVVQEFSLKEANIALQKLKKGQIQGCGVLIID
jgi:propanol-preferring alcohol dehydrogenase